MPFSPTLIAPAVQRYRRERDRYIKLADRIAEICRTEICDNSAIRAQVTSRAKSVSSFENKLRRFSQKPDKTFKGADEIFSEISDLAGVRIAAYRQEDCDAIIDGLKKIFCGVDNNPIKIDIKDRNKENEYNYYRATHLQACLFEDELVGTYDNLDDVSCEIQVCTMMAHVWNEIEHDIGYKPDKGDPEELELHVLKQLGENVRSGDKIISDLIKAFDRRIKKRDGKFHDVHDFVARLRGEYKDVDIGRNSGQLFELIDRLDLLVPSKLKADMNGNMNLKDAVENINMFNDFLKYKEENVPQMDANSSDILLIQLLSNKGSEIVESFKGRVGRGRGRPNRLYRLAKYYQEFLKQKAPA